MACGVGDHSARLHDALRDQGHEVAVTADLVSLLGEQRPQAAAADIILVQYTPSLWSRGRLMLNPRLAWDLLRLKRLRHARVMLIAHEVHYPTGWDLRGIVFGWGQWLQFLAIARTVDWIFFTYEPARLSLFASRPGMLAKSSTLAVGSNILATMQPKSSAVDEEINLVHFGGNHPTHLLDWTVQALVSLRRTHATTKITLTWIGLGDRAKDEILHRMGRLELSPHIHALGYLSEEDVSAALYGATLILAPFMDGISTRRGSVMAAFLHGRPVITTIGWASDPRTDWESFCLATRLEGSPVPTAGDRDRFCQCVVQAVQDLGRRDGIAASGRAAYARLFAWPVIAASLVAKFIDQPSYGTAENVDLTQCKRLGSKQGDVVSPPL